jgi:hypothetical protein
LALDDRDVTVDRQLSEAFDSAGLWPFYFQPVDFRSFPNAEHYTWIVPG